MVCVCARVGTRGKKKEETLEDLCREENKTSEVIQNLPLSPIAFGMTGKTFLQVEIVAK